MRKLSKIIQNQIQETYKISCKIKYNANNRTGKKLEIIPVFKNLSEKQTFKVNVNIGWKKITLDFSPGNFAGRMIREIQRRNKENKNQFINVVNQIEKQKIAFRFSINNNEKDPKDEETWKGRWESLKFSLKHAPIDIDHDNEKELNEKTWFLVSFCLDILESLQFFSEEGNENKNDREYENGLPEGAVKKVKINRYERNAVNRNICLREYGYLCQICSFNFEEKYGEIGKNFIHVHHLTPVSEMGENYVVNPVKDLIPVCPNCHSMIHKKNPPYTIEEMKEKLR